MSSVDSHAETPDQIAPNSTQSSVDQKPNQVKRKHILNAAVAIIGGLTFQGAINQSASHTDVINALKTSHTATASVTPTKTPEPSPTIQPTASSTQQQNMDDILYATATALSKENKQSSFQPEGEFTQEIFNKVQQATFKIGIVGMVTDDKGQKGMEYLLGTTWLVGANRHREGQYDFVTNAHVVAYGKIEIQQLYITRPGIDQTPLSLGPGSCKTVASENFDDAILSCRFSTDQLTQMSMSIPPSPLDFLDAYQLKSDEKVLTVGFPGDFDISSGPDLKSRTLGEVVTVDGTDQNMGHQVVMAKGLSSQGGSGSPSIKVIDQIPAVVGMIYAGHGEQDVMITPMDVQVLLDQLDSQK